MHRIRRRTARLVRVRIARLVRVRIVRLLFVRIALLVLVHIARLVSVKDRMDTTDRHGIRAGTISGLSAYLLWGLFTAFWKLLDSFNALELIGWRIITAAVILTVLVVVQRRVGDVAAALRNPMLALRVTGAATMLAINWTLYVWAVVNEHVIETALGYFISPLLTSVTGVLVLGERLRRLQQAALVLAVASVIVLTVSYGRPPFVALAIAASWTVYGLMKKQVPLRPVDSLAAETVVLLVPAVAVVIWSFSRTGGIPETASFAEFVLVLLTGGVTAAPLLLFAHSAQRLPLTLIGPLQYLVPVINFLLGWLAYGEPLSATGFIGFGFVWCGLVISIVDTARHRSPVASSVDPATR